MIYPGYDAQWLSLHGAQHTAQEIAQQPTLWRHLSLMLQAKKTQNEDFLFPVLALPNLRIILIGAGTSAYAGEAIAPWLRTKGLDVSAIASTDIVSNPTQYLNADKPTLLVSFARSGNSPESVAAVALADKIVSHVWHLILTCNEEGELFRYAQENKQALCYLMPEGANDKSFAMTSSYSCMALSAIGLLGGQQEQWAAHIEQLATIVEQEMPHWSNKANALAELDYKRLVILGSGGLAGAARESALKSLELSAGLVATCFDSSLGFRHGPKFMIDAETVVIQFVSSNAYTQKYDIDMQKEIHENGKALAHLSLTPTDLQGVSGDCIPVLKRAETGSLSDIWLTFAYVVFAQMLGMSKSLQLGLTPDNPCPSGEVNRVVQGVTIYPYISE